MVAVARTVHPWISGLGVSTFDGSKFRLDRGSVVGLGGHRARNLGGLTSELTVTLSRDV